MRFRRPVTLLLGAALAAAILSLPTVLLAASRIDIEPEKGTRTAPIKVYSAKQCSGGKCIGTDDEIVAKGEECGGSVKVTFNVEAAGTYVLWARCKWIDDCGDSFYIKMDGGSKRKFGEQGNEGEWRWYKAKTNATYSLSAGQHTLTIEGREDGARMDKLLLTTNTDYTPQGTNG